MTKPRILIVEDEVSVSLDLTYQLEESGYEVVDTVLSGEAALKKAGETRPDLILMDVKLRGRMDGIEAARIIRSSQDTPVVYLTAHGERHLFERAKTTEPFGYLSKPVYPKDLLYCVEMALYKNEMQRRLRESEEKLAGVIGAVTDQLSMIDEHHSIVWANEVVARFFDRDVNGLKCYSVYHGRDSVCDHCIVAKTFADGRIHEREKAIKNSRGEELIFWCISNVASRDQNAKPKLVVQVSRDVTVRRQEQEELRRAHDELDQRVRERTAELAKSNELLREEITERKKAEELATLSRERLEAVFETTPDCLYLKDRAHRYVLVNPCFTALMEQPESDILGKTDREVFGQEIGNRLKKVDDRVLGGETIEEERTLTVNGSPVTLLDVRAPMRNAQGQIVGICGVSRNITERSGKPVYEHELSVESPSVAMQSTLASARLAGNTDSIVLLTGESGAGKDYLARYIHNQSPRSSNPFYAINCAAIPRELAESELFGHESGAFTGARRRKRGMFELAEGGTLLLNEIGELTQPIQAKLLTFLDTWSFTRLGGERNITVDARLIAATNKDLEKEVRAGRFRHDLFYRLNVLSISLPPLRQRKEDIPGLVSRILGELATEMQLRFIPEVDREALSGMQRYSWPGNVRELRNVLERALILSNGGRVKLEHLALHKEVRSMGLMSSEYSWDQPLLEFLDTAKRSIIGEALERSNGNKLQAARLLGMSRYALSRHAKKLGIA
jgi:PAS domain S-box-containing protein